MNGNKNFELEQKELFPLSESNDDIIDFDELEKQLTEQIELNQDELEFIETEKELIGNADNLGENIKNVVWEQFVNQVGVVAGEEFIKENRGMTLDLRKSAHIQTTENFADGKIATHNTEIDYQQRYDDWQNNFQKDENGQVKKRIDRRSGKEKEVLTPDARAPFDKGRPKGSVQEHMDHTVSAGEIIRDPAANAHMTKEEQIAFANSDKNLNPLDAEANISKGDSTMTEWLESERNGEKPSERFNIDEEELRNKDKEAREEYEKVKNEGEKKSIEAGKKSRKAEAARIGGQALKSVIMMLLADLIKDIIAQLIKWLKSANKKISTFIDALKKAVHSFINNLKQHIKDAGNAMLTTVATAILGPVVGIIKKVWMLLKQGWNSIKEAIAYIRKPENNGKSFNELIPEIGKIIIAGLTGVGSIVLSELIEQGLSSIPVFAVQIPILGISLANIIGMFMGATVCGIIGAIAINMINKAVANKREEQLRAQRIQIGNEILANQKTDIEVKQIQLNRQKAEMAMNTTERHRDLSDSMDKYFEKRESNDESHKKNSETLSDSINMLDNL